MIFWMKVRAGWRETARVELSGPDGAPLNFDAAAARERIEARLASYPAGSVEAARLLQSPPLPGDGSTEPGRAFRPTEEQRRTVKAMAGLGVPHDGIAVLLDIDPKTLRKHFQAELERGSVEATAKVAQSLFQLATTGKSVAAAIFWMKARAGWREKHEVQVTTGSDYSKLTDAELERLVNEGFEQWAEEKARLQARTLEGEVEEG